MPNKNLWPYLILFITLPVLAFPDLIFGNQTLYWTDLSWIHYPRRQLAATTWLTGQIPLWDPYQDTGIPLLAETQIGVLYPFSLLFLSSLDPSLELSLFILLHFSLAACFTFILARSLGLSYPSAGIAGLSYGYGGFLMGQLPNLNIMTGAVWLPLILWSVHWAIQQQHFRVAMIAGLPLTMQILTAQPQIVFYTVVTIIGYAMYRVLANYYLGTKQNSINQKDSVGNNRLSRTDKDSEQPTPHYPSTATWRYYLSPFIIIIIIVMTGILLATPQLLPTYEQQQLSVRDAERSYKFLTKTSWPPIMALNLLIPSGLGNNVTGFKLGDPFQEVFVYAGFLPLLLVPFSWLQRHRRDTIFFICLLIGGILLAWGSYTPLYHLIQYIPGFALFRIPARWLMVVNLALAILAGLGLQAILTSKLAKRGWQGVTIFNVILLISLCLTWLFGDTILSLTNNLPEIYQRAVKVFLQRGFSTEIIYQERLLLQWLIPFTIPAILLTVNILISQLLFTLYYYRYLSAPLFSWVLLMVVSFDLILAGGVTLNPTQPQSWWHNLSGGAQYVLDNLENDQRVFPLGMGSEQATVSHLGQYFASVYQVRSAGGHGSSLRSARYEQFVDTAHPVVAVKVLGVRYLLTLGQLGADAAATYPLVYQDAESYVYENPNPTPRVIIVPDTIVVETETEAMTLLQNGDFNPTETVILEYDTVSPPASLSSTNPTSSTAAIINETAGHLEIKATLNEPGYLVLLDTYYPGWTATMNQQLTPIYRANYLHRAIYLPTGEHTVRFIYWPWSFWAGVVIATITLSLLSGVWGYQWWYKTTH